MPKLPRFLLSKSYYHIITRGNNKNIIFRKHEDYLYFLNLIKKYKKNHPFDLYHYCLMPNHVHFLVKTKDSYLFSSFMKKLNLSYYHYFKEEYGWAGHFWQGRYKSQPVGKDKYFLQCGKYIELNPVRACIVDNPGDYKYSSYNYYIKEEENSIITKDPFYKFFGNNKQERQKRYKEIYIDEIVKDSYSKSVWGGSIQKQRESQKIKRKLKKARIPD